MSKKILALLLALVMIVGVFAACGDGGNKSSGGNSSTSSTAGGDESNGGDDGEPSNVSTGADDVSEPYSFRCYWYYDYAQIKEWGADAFSKFMAEKFNVDIDFEKPDADSDSKLQLMLTGGDLPDAMIVDRGRVLRNCVQANALVEIEQFMYDGCTFEKDVGPETRELLKVDGKLYGVPNWPRAPGKASTGGNDQWIVNTKIYEAAGKPALNTLEDLHQYALKAKELSEGGLKAYSGQDIIPVAFTNNGGGLQNYKSFFRSFGGRNIVENYFTQEEGKLDLCVNTPLFVEALREVNKWYREGLWTQDVYTDNGDQWLEKMTNGRPALFFYDFSQDDTNNFRRVCVEKSTEAGDVTSYEVIGDPASADFASFPQFPPVSADTITYGDEAGSPGWNVNVITTKAERPQRIFDLFTWMISEEGSMYQVLGGPEGPIWDGKFDEEGNAILNIDYGKITSKEQDAAGAWLWTQPAHADYVDAFKYGVNERSGVKNWVVSIQADLCTYDEADPKVGQKFKTDQNTGIGDVIESTSDLGIALKTIQDQCLAELPKIMAAESDEEFDKLVADLQDFAAKNKLADILTEWQKKYDANIEMQGFDAYSEDYDVYGLKK